MTSSATQPAVLAPPLPNSAATGRRAFLKQSAVLGTAWWVSSGAPGWAESKSPNEKLNVGCVGCGGKGYSDIQGVASENIVALCDVDDNRAAKAAMEFPAARRYQDFREMLEKEKLDAVVVSTPDHTHAVAAVMAMRLGKHVYCQKPLAHSVFEARVMRQVAAEMKVATQMGNQGASLSGARTAIEVIQSGAIGPVREVHVWTNRPGRWWKQAPEVVARPVETPPVPPHLKWDLFLGPAAERAYSPLYHPFAWRGWWDFGTGALGDMACHTAHMAFLALKLGAPTSVVAESSEVNPETYPLWATIHYDFPVRGNLPEVKLVWYEGTRDGQRNLPPPNLTPGQTLPGSGLLLVGDKGILYSPNDYGAEFILLPEKAFEGYKAPEPTLPRHEGANMDLNQKREWITACKGGPPGMSHFEYAGLFTEAMLLGNVAMRVGKRIEWDGPNMKVTNVPEAEQYIRPEFRKGWVL